MVTGLFRFFGGSPTALPLVAYLFKLPLPLTLQFKARTFLRKNSVIHAYIPMKGK